MALKDGMTVTSKKRRSVKTKASWQAKHASAVHHGEGLSDRAWSQGLFCQGCLTTLGLTVLTESLKIGPSKAIDIGHRHRRGLSACCI
jgi:hypothetical protein